MKACIFLSSMYVIFSYTSCPESNVNTLHRYMLANCQQHAGNYAQAHEWYQKVMSSGNFSIYAYKGYCPLLFSLGEFQKIAYLIPHIDPIFAHDPEMGLLFAHTLQRLGKQEEADARFIELSSRFKQHSDIALQAVNAFIRRKELENALTTIDTLLNSCTRKANNFVFYFLKSQLSLKLGNTAEALKNIQLCLDKQPYFDKGWLLFALLHEQEGKLQEAIKGYTTFLELTGSNQGIEQHLIQLMLKEKVATNTPEADALDKKFKNIFAFFDTGDYQQAAHLVDKALEAHQGNKELRLLKLQLLIAQRQQVGALEVLKKWILEDEADSSYWINIASLFTQLGISYHTLIKIFVDIASSQPRNLDLLLHISDLLLKSNNRVKAIDYLQQALNLNPVGPLLEKIVFQLALTYYEEEKTQALDALFTRYNPRSFNLAPLLNLSAYYYASTQKNLDLAQHLITRALTMAPNNPHYLDTQAFLWYKQKKYQKAYDVLHTLAQTFPQDATILTNLGKTQYKLGNQAHASSTLEQAVTHAQNNQQKQVCIKYLNRWNHILP